MTTSARHAPGRIISAPTSSSQAPYAPGQPLLPLRGNSPSRSPRHKCHGSFTSLLVLSPQNPLCWAFVGAIRCVAAFVGPDALIGPCRASKTPLKIDLPRLDLQPQGGTSKRGDRSPPFAWSVSRSGVFQGEREIEIPLPLNGVLPPLPTRAKEVAPQSEIFRANHT